VARLMQGIIIKHRLMKKPPDGRDKSGGAGAAPDGRERSAATRTSGRSVPRSTAS